MSKVEAEKAGKIYLSDEARDTALSAIMLAVDDPSIQKLDLHAPEAWGLEIPERLFREAYIMRQEM